MSLFNHTLISTVKVVTLGLQRPFEHLVDLSLSITQSKNIDLYNMGQRALKK